MRTIALGSSASAGVQASVRPFDKFVLGDEKVGVFQATFGESGTAKLEGRLNGAAAFTEIAVIVNTDTSLAKVVALMPEMRLNITTTSGTTSGFLGV